MASDEQHLSLTCPMCHSKDFEQIRLYGNRELFWKTFEPTERQSDLLETMGLQAVTAHRCLNCDYVAMFAPKPSH